MALTIRPIRTIPCFIFHVVYQQIAWYYIHNYWTTMQRQVDEYSRNIITLNQRREQNKYGLSSRPRILIWKKKSVLSQ